jgi:hypothetical protein
MSASNYLELELLDHVFGNGSYTPPTVYVALLTATPDDADTGSTITEANYTGYARVSTSASDWATAAAGAIDNANAITFGACTGGSSDCTHFAMVDAASAGNVLFWGALDSTFSVSSGVTPSFSVGDLEITCD